MTETRPEQRASATRLAGTTVAKYTVGALGTSGFATLPGLVLTYYMTDNLGIAAIAAGAIVLVAKIWDLVFLPLVGALSDREHARTGSRRRLMRIGAIAFPVAFAAIFAAPPQLGPVVTGAWVLFGFVLTSAAFDLFVVPYVALPAELTHSYDERTRLLAWRVVLVTISAFLFGVGGPALRELAGDPVTGYLIMGIGAATLMGAGLIAATFSAPRAIVTAPAPDADGTRSVFAHYGSGFLAIRRSPNFRALLTTFVLQTVAATLMLGGTQYIATWILGDESAVQLLFVAIVAPAVLAGPAWAWVARRLGKETAMTLANLLLAAAALSMLAMLWAPGPWVFAASAAVGVASAAMQTLPMSMLADVIADDASRHPRSAGAFSGMWTVAESIGSAVGAAALTLTLAVTGYVASSAAETVAQPESARAGIVIAFSILPAVVMAIGAFAFSRYRLRRADIDALGDAVDRAATTVD